MQIIYFILAILLLIAWLWKPLLIGIGSVIVVYLVIFLFKSYKTHPKSVIIGIVSFLFLVCIVFMARSCEEKQRIGTYRNYNLQEAVTIIQEHNVSTDAVPSIFYNFINDSLNNCKYIDFDLLFSKLVNIGKSDEDSRYELYIGSAYSGKVLTYRNRFIDNNQRLLEDLESVIRKISLEFGPPHYDVFNDSLSIRTTKWEFDRLHILLYGNQSSTVAVGSTSIFDPKVLNYNK